MSSNQSSYTSYSSTSYSSSSSTNPSGVTKSYTEQISSDDKNGTNIERTSAETGKPTLVDQKFIPPAAENRIGGAEEPARIEDVSETDKEYLDKMEDEYAKREGGA